MRGLESQEGEQVALAGIAMHRAILLPPTIPGVVEVGEVGRQRVQLDPPPEGEQQLEVTRGGGERESGGGGALAELLQEAAGGRHGGVQQQLKRERGGLAVHSQIMFRAKDPSQF